MKMQTGGHTGRESLTGEAVKIAANKLRTESPRANGADAAYGEKGALRTDVILMEGDRVIAVWDYKTGAGSRISERRVDALRNAVTPSDVPMTVYFKVLHIPFYGRGS